MISNSAADMEKDLQGALDRNEFVVFYQPQIDLRIGKIVGNEALIRWKHPVWGFVPPEEFIPVAEKMGLIIPIGEWVVSTACRQNKQWQDKGFQPMVMSVNLSPLQFEETDLYDMIKAVIEETGLDPQFLDLEITESMTMDVERAILTLYRLKALGVSISIDDFGKGYSSLNYLKRFPIDSLKIDKSFVRDCTADINDATIVKTIISMAHNLNLSVIAEGVENGAHLVFLQQHLCNVAQGYLFSKPLPAEELEPKFTEIEKVLPEYGIETHHAERIWTEERLRAAREELQDTIRQQQGMTLKFSKIDGRFVHTFCDGELLYRLGFIPQQIIGRELQDFLPSDDATWKTAFYDRAWNGEDVSYENFLNGIWYFASLRAIPRGGKIVEVIASCVDITPSKLSKEMAAAANEQIRSLFNHIHEAMVGDEKNIEHTSSVTLKDGSVVDITSIVKRKERRASDCVYSKE
jgi:EAL domain-containing protein (putative c-di-GMP-specific phosphodiesterase class I)